MKRVIFILFVLLCLSGCGERKEYLEARMMFRTLWDNEDCITFANPDGSIAASFKLKDLKKLEMWLYDGGLDYTEELKNYRGQLHLYQGKRTRIVETN